MMKLKDLEKTLSGLVMDLKPAPEVPVDAVPFESINFERSENDNTKWIIHLFCNSSTYHLCCE